MRSWSNWNCGRESLGRHEGFFQPNLDVPHRQSAAGFRLHYFQETPLTSPALCCPYCYIGSADVRGEILSAVRQTESGLCNVLEIKCNSTDARVTIVEKVLRKHFDIKMVYLSPRVQRRSCNCRSKERQGDIHMIHWENWGGKQKLSEEALEEKRSGCE